MRKYVDDHGQFNLVEASKAAGVDRFVFVSFRRPRESILPTGRCESDSIRGSDQGAELYEQIQASWFMEVWLSPAL